MDLNQVAILPFSILGLVYAFNLLCFPKEKKIKRRKLKRPSNPSACTVEEICLKSRHERNKADTKVEKKIERKQ